MSLKKTGIIEPGCLWRIVVEDDSELVNKMGILRHYITFPSVWKKVLHARQSSAGIWILYDPRSLLLRKESNDREVAGI